VFFDSLEAAETSWQSDKQFKILKKVFFCFTVNVVRVMLQFVRLLLQGGDDCEVVRPQACRNEKIDLLDEFVKLK